MSLSMSQSRIISIPSRTSHTPQRSAWLIVRLTARPHRTRSDHISQYCNGAGRPGNESGMSYHTLPHTLRQPVSL